MRAINSGSVCMVLVLACAWGCSAGSNGTGQGNDSAQGGSGTASTTGGAAPGGSSGDGGTTSQFMGVGGSNTVGCDSGPDEDKDLDGFTSALGDCNDCDANVNPGAIEVIPDDSGEGGAGGAAEYVPADEDCDGTADNVAPGCDDGLAIAGTDPRDGARAIELCKDATSDSDWGVISASWVRANGTPASVNLHMGILDGFGPNVATREGTHMLAISSGAARDTGDPGFCAHSCSYNGAGTPPAGFPQDVPSCAGMTNINDDVGLEVAVRAPSNATGYKFDFKFYSNEFPEYVCTSFNDQFIALVNPAPEGAINGNVSFDSMNNPVSVNIAFFDVCLFSSFYPQFPCASGPAELEGTDFTPDEGGTSWLQTTVPVTGGETFSIRFATWDTGDTGWDSTTLIDGFTWIASGGTVIVGTTPIPQ